MKNRATTLPTTSEERKKFPIASGVLDYFPDAFVALARLSQQGNDQHNPGKPLFWDRPKSSDHADTLMRHFVERGTIDTDGIRHSAKVAWRALAILQLEIEAAQEIKTSGGKVPKNPRNSYYTIGCYTYYNRRTGVEDRRIAPSSYSYGFTKDRYKGPFRRNNISLYPAIYGRRSGDTSSK